MDAEPDGTTSRSKASQERKAEFVGRDDERKRGGGPLKRRNERDNKGEKGKHGKSAGKPEIGSVRWYDSHRLVFLFYNPQKRDCLFSLLGSKRIAKGVGK